MSQPYGALVRQQPSPGLAGEQPGGQLWVYANLLLQHLRVVIGLPLAVAFLVAVISVLRPRQYVASASFVPQEPSTQQTGLNQLAGQFGLSLAQASTASPLFYGDLLQSREILRFVVLTPYGSDSSGASRSLFHGNLIEYFGVKPQAPDRMLGLAIDKLQRNLFVRTDRTTGIVRLEVVTRYPELSAAVARRFLDLVAEFNLRRRQSQGRAERQFTEQQLAMAKDSLGTAEDALAGFYRGNRQWRDSPELVAAEARLQRQVAVRQQVYLTLAQSYETAKIEEVRNTPVITVIDPPEGLVARRSRGTVRYVILALFGTLALAIAGVAGMDSMERARHEGTPALEEVLSRLRSRRGLGRLVSKLWPPVSA